MTIERKPAKPKKCRVATCRALFVPSRMGQAVCSPACALIDGPRHAPKARKALADIERKEIKVRKEKLKSRADHLKDTQQAFNAWIPIPPNDDHAACNERCVADYRQGSAARHDPSQACEGSVPGDPGPAIIQG